MRVLKTLVLLLFLIQTNVTVSQTILQADGPGETYELINSVLAPGFNVVESPDCSHEIFGRHIDEIFDSELNTNVFRFHIHTTLDNDRCINFDRQRNEIKTYNKSPDSLLAVKDELVEYKWKFKIDEVFQSSSSFTHLHQIKAVGGTEDAMPLITFTARKGSPDQFELRYAEALTQVTLKKVELTPFMGEWLEVTETILFGEIDVGEYYVSISKVSDSAVLFEYSNESIRMWKTDAEFLRPKWGIYRSLNDQSSLRDEEVLFADIRIEEIKDPVLAIEDLNNELIDTIVAPNPFNKTIVLTDYISAEYDKVYIYDSTGKLVLKQKIISNKLDVAFLKEGLYFVLITGPNTGPKTIKMIKKTT